MGRRRADLVQAEKILRGLVAKGRKGRKVPGFEQVLEGLRKMSDGTCTKYDFATC